METNNKNKIWTAVVIVSLLIFAGGVYAYYSSVISEKETGGVAARNSSGIQETRQFAAAQYIRANIATLSPEPAVMGGTLQVTNVDFTSDHEGVATYEDGHNLFVGRFTYEVIDDGAVTINSFDVDSNFDAKG
ncbi:MAG TPA: hypothetical protein PLF31_01700 [Candidatus Paceibacterota bacterium]|nr:hypothetical protein [Candidatus Paceibacterota bacterium]